jgi:hypothetical protein
MGGRRCRAGTGRSSARTRTGLGCSCSLSPAEGRVMRRWAPRSTTSYELARCLLQLSWPGQSRQLCCIPQGTRHGMCSQPAEHQMQQCGWQMLRETTCLALQAQAAGMQAPKAWGPIHSSCGLLNVCSPLWNCDWAEIQINWYEYVSHTPYLGAV